jgi:hypothetical protein
LARAPQGWSKRFDEPIVLDDGPKLTTVVRDKMNKQIAFKLGATERQVASPAGHGKTKVESLAELVTIAERLGLLA